MPKNKIVVLSGAGISAESGVKTFRDNDGLWENYNVKDVATPEAWRRDRELVLRFYNERRTQMETTEPNFGHEALKLLENEYKVSIITQNVDDLHEKAGSTNVLHIHGELSKAQSTLDPSLVYDIGYDDINVGDKCEKGSQLRPFVVWFGEDVPLITNAAHEISDADIVIVIGTSMQIYPAAQLVDFAPKGTPIYVVDPNSPEVDLPNVTYIKKGGSEGMKELLEKLMTVTHG